MIGFNESNTLGASFNCKIRLYNEKMSPFMRLQSQKPLGLLSERNAAFSPHICWVATVYTGCECYTGERPKPVSERKRAVYEAQRIEPTKKCSDTDLILRESALFKALGIFLSIFTLLSWAYFCWGTGGGD